VLRAPPERVYRAFVDAAALARWLPPKGFTCTVHALDARVGGSYRISFASFATGEGHSFGGEFLELEAGKRIRHTDRFDDPGLPGTMTTTIVLREVACGTDLSIEQAGVPAPIPLEMCHLGWQESLDQLADLVEPEIRG
jgi:uncharacterized protein YndB with AHSA1/START domain